MCYERRIIPLAINSYPLPAFLWNERCLRAPKPFMIDGYYHIPPYRRVRPGFIVVPTGFTTTPSTVRDVVEPLRGRVRNTNKAIDNLLKSLI